MKIGLKKTALTCLLLLGVGHALAQAPAFRGGPQRMQAGYTQRVVENGQGMDQTIQNTESAQPSLPGSSGGGSDSQSQGLDERRRLRDSLGADSSGGAAQRDYGNGPADAARRSSKLSPEERRALRRQIDEAGADLYSRKR